MIRGVGGQRVLGITYRGVGAAGDRALVCRHCPAVAGGLTILKAYYRTAAIGINRAV